MEVNGLCINITPIEGEVVKSYLIIHVSWLLVHPNLSSLN